MSTPTTILDIRSNFDTLITQLEKYAQEEAKRISDFSGLISSPNMGTATEAVINDIAGKSIATPGTGLNVFINVIKRRSDELDKINSAKDEIAKIKTILRNVGGRFANGE